MTHTPGPWRYTNEPFDDGMPYCRIMGGDLSPDFSTMGFRIVGVMREDDARIMTASPDLLEALKYARRFLNEKDHDVALVDAVIERATGS